MLDVQSNRKQFSMQLQGKISFLISKCHTEEKHIYQNEMNKTLKQTSDLFGIVKAQFLIPKL